MLMIRAQYTHSLKHIPCFNNRHSCSVQWTCLQHCHMNEWLHVWEYEWSKTTPISSYYDTTIQQFFIEFFIQFPHVVKILIKCYNILKQLWFPSGLSYILPQRLCCIRLDDYSCEVPFPMCYWITQSADDDDSRRFLNRTDIIDETDLLLTWTMALRRLRSQICCWEDTEWLPIHVGNCIRAGSLFSSDYTRCVLRT